jgi:S-formylglutathione hydrolase
VDIGDSDRFVEEWLPELLEARCAPAGIALSLRYQPGYDRSYYIISARSSCPITLLGMGRDCEGG